MVLLVLAAVLTAGCGYRGLSFVQDHRLEIVAPEDRAEVTLPLTVQWTVEDFDEDGSFAVFVDRAPQAPGRTVESLASGDQMCDIDPACPNETYFASRGVFVTQDNQVTIDHIPNTAADDPDTLHEVSVVLLDADGARIGESVWRVEFRLDDEETA